LASSIHEYYTANTHYKKRSRFCNTKPVFSTNSWTSSSFYDYSANAQYKHQSRFCTAVPASATRIPGFLAEASTSTAGSTAGTPLPTRKNDQSLSQQCQPPQENVKKSPFIDIAPWPLADNGGNPVTQYQPQPPQQMIEYPPLLNIAPKPRTPPVNNNSQHQPPQQMVEHPHISPTPFRPGNSATTSTNPTLLLPMFNKQSLRIPDKSSTRDSE